MTVDICWLYFSSVLNSCLRFRAVNDIIVAQFLEDERKKRNEDDVAALEGETCAQDWFPRPQGDERWSQGSCSPSCKGP